MKQHTVKAVFVVLLLFAHLSTLGGQQPLSDVTGTWRFSVQLEDGNVGEPTFTLRQNGKRIDGTYSGPLGEHKIIGSIEGKRITLSFVFEGEGSSIKATYTGQVKSTTNMSGTASFAGGAAGMAGKWVARKVEGESPGTAGKEKPKK